MKAKFGLVLALELLTWPARAEVPAINQTHSGTKAATPASAGSPIANGQRSERERGQLACWMYKAAKTPTEAADRNPEVTALVTRIAAEEGISPILALSLVYQESRFDPCATSPAGAHGLAQLMPGTAMDLGVDRNSVEQNVRGGMRYLMQQLCRHDGNIRLALAAYNAGPGNVRKYGGVPPFKETRGYIEAIQNKWMIAFDSYLPPKDKSIAPSDGPSRATGGSRGSVVAESAATVIADIGTVTHAYDADKTETSGAAAALRKIGALNAGICNAKLCDDRSPRDP
jgi:hypothetical protein